LPDGLFSNQNPSFGTFWMHFERKIFDTFYDHLVHFVAICFIPWQLGILSGNSLKYPHFGILCQEKSGNPGKRAFLYFSFSFISRLFVSTLSVTKSWPKKLPHHECASFFVRLFVWPSLSFFQVFAIRLFST
jgi:hypothetical protein